MLASCGRLSPLGQLFEGWDFPAFSLSLFCFPCLLSDFLTKRIPFLLLAFSSRFLVPRGGGLSQIWSSLPCFLEFSCISDCCWLMATANLSVRGGLRFFGDSEGFSLFLNKASLFTLASGWVKNSFFSLLALSLPLEVPFFCSFRTGKKMICCLISSSKMPYFLFPFFRKNFGRKVSLSCFLLKDQESCP